MENRKQPSCSNSEEAEIRKGPWTMEEDLILMNYIGAHGEGVWNSLAKAAGLKRTGKSCRLRWLNYLRPDVRRGNITQEEQILIMDLHAKWGNRWSKIAKHLPGRTDNEIKNFWRTRIQKQLKQGGIGGDGDGVRGGCSNAAEQQQQSSNSEHSTSQMSTAGSSHGAHHDPYSASSYRVPAPNMDTSFHLGSGSGSGSGSGYYVMHPPPPPHATMPLDPAEQYWPHAMDAEFWPMHLFNPDQGKPM